MNRPLVLLFAACAFMLAGRAAGQCSGALIPPYLEGFEAGPAWTSGGTGNDWAWGTPAHFNINSAANGTKAWCVGGLTGSFYTFGEQSWLEGPCFDFTAVQFPYVSFKIFWECERNYDGLGFQYSLDQGASWSNVGTYGETPDCVDSNWYNNGSITNLDLASPSAGWSGRIGPTNGSCTGGAGSNGWVAASHCLVELAGEPSVKFRFVFGAGTTCNNYDGIAIDEVYVGTAPVELDAGFQMECFGSEVSVHDIESCAPTWTWDFGDPASGAANTSTLADAGHVYSSPGDYTLTLTLEHTCRDPMIMSLPLTILDLQIDGTDPTCSGSDGSVEAVVTGGSGTYTYGWIPGGATTSLVTGLGPDTYYVLVNDGGLCPAGDSLTLAAPAQAPQFTVDPQGVSCFGGSDGSATVTVISALPGYIISWAPQGGAGVSANGLAAGDYSCTITDPQACSTTIDFTINEPDELVITATDDLSICAGDNATLEASVAGGTADYTITWSPDGPDVAPQSTTTYTVNATDANGCSAAAQEVVVTVGSVATPSFILNDTLGCSPHCILFTADAPIDGTLNWTFGDGGTGEGAEPEHCYAQAGAFDVTLTVTSPDGCNGAWTLVEAVDVLPSPNAAFSTTPLVATIDDPSVQFVDLSSGAEEWLWSFGDPADSMSVIASPEFVYPDVGCYTVWLRVSNSFACTDSVSGIFCVEDEFAAYVPNAFTPNDDGFNDSWGVITTVGDPVVFELFVFDRWGGLLFDATDKNHSWTGDGIPQGVYPWRLRLIDSKGMQQVRTGHVTLLR